MHLSRYSHLSPFKVLSDSAADIHVTFYPNVLMGFG